MAKQPPKQKTLDPSQNLAVSTQYDHAWVNSNNEILSMDTSTNPNEMTLYNSQSWSRVK